MGQPRKSINLYSGFGLSALLIGAYLAVANVVTKAVDYRIALYSIIVLLGLATVLGGEEGLVLAFLGWIACFSIGDRTMAVSTNLKIHPLEIILSITFVLIFIAPRSRSAPAERIIVPGWLFALAPFCIWGWYLGVENGYRKDAMFSEARSFLLLFPMFIVASVILCNRERWRTALAVFYGTGTWIAAWGVAEYYFPGVRRLFPGFITVAGVGSRPADGFARAAFSFWGSPAATYTCALAIPFAIPLWRWFPAVWQRIVLLLAIVMMADAVYIGGHRILWVTLALQFAMFTWFRKKYVLAGVALIAMLVASSLVPDSTQKRFNTFFEVLRGTPVAGDSSGQLHLSRLIDGIDQALDQPAGVGWTGAGWVHCEFVQIAANLSIPAGFIYLSGFLMVLWRLLDRAARRGISSEYRDVVVAALLSLVAAGGLLGTEAISVAPQLGYPVFFSWVLAEILARQPDFEGRRKRNAPPNLRAAADMELRGYGPQHAGVR